MKDRTRRAIDRQEEIKYYLELVDQFSYEAEAFKRTAKRIEKEART